MVQRKNILKQCKGNGSQNVILIAKTLIKSGEKITRKNITYKRPAIGIEPKFISLILGKKVRQNKNEDDPIEWEDLLEG